MNANTHLNSYSPPTSFLLSSNFHLFLLKGYIFLYSIAFRPNCWDPTDPVDMFFYPGHTLA